MIEAIKHLMIEAIKHLMIEAIKHGISANHRPS